MVDRDFFDRPVLEVAPDLLGQVVVRRTSTGAVALLITEVEAYGGPDDPASHSYRGRTARNASMWGPPGHAYVYLSYGVHFAFNLVCGPEGKASGVLMRAGEVLEGVDLARHRRRAARKDSDLARGPGRLGQALGIDRTLDGTDVCVPGPLTVHRGPSEAHTVQRGPRTGVSKAADVPWRFWLEGHVTVSPYRPHRPRRRLPA
jgi:DNA-3-methyladenine glycosylase